MNALRVSTIFAAPVLTVVAPSVLAPPARAAQRLVETIPGADFDVGAGPVIRMVTGTTTEPVSGVGFTALWTAVVADQENGVAPWSLDLDINIAAPNGVDQISWGPIGGDRTFADYPLQDFTSGLPDVSGQGNFTWTFTSVGPPWVAGLRNVEYHLLAETPDVQQVINGSVLAGPMWDRPFFIAGVSGLGPVVYDAVEFTVPVAGGYSFVSVLPNSDNNFTFLYQGAFDPTLPLQNLLDYGLGNGSAPNGTPQGTSRIDALLLENTTYFFITSQFDRFTPGSDFVNTITGPAAMNIAGACIADLNGDGNVGAGDVAILLGAWGTANPIADLNNDGIIGAADLSLLLGSWGPCPALAPLPSHIDP